VKVRVAEPPSLIWDVDARTVIVGAVVARALAKALADSASLGPSAGFIRVVWHEAVRFKATRANVTSETRSESGRRDHIVRERKFTKTFL
jgi:hypothetical protein